MVCDAFSQKTEELSKVHIRKRINNHTSGSHFDCEIRNSELPPAAAFFYLFLAQTRVKVAIADRSYLYFAGA